MYNIEVNFDGIVGPTHNYAGLSTGNKASCKNAGESSNPLLAAKQGLDKMMLFHKLGITQGVIPPHDRPDIPMLRQLGFDGSDIAVLNKVANNYPELLKLCYSASSMWAANSATVSPSVDSQDQKIHFTTANLNYLFHRSLEASTTFNLLQAIFPDKNYFCHHQPRPQNHHFTDEGSANHMRICADYHKQGVQVFVYGYDSFSGKGSSELCRQTLAASESVARLHRISPSKLIFVKQNPDVVTQGVFHNDVIATNNKNVLMYHEHAFENKNAFLDNLHTAYGNNGPLHTLEVKNKDISIENAVKSYLFNSQIVSTLNKDMTLVAPIECSENPAIVKYIDDLISADNPITNKCFVDLRQSMKNGGGPACLRLRVVMNRESLAKVAPQCLFSNSTYTMLSKWIDKHYRDRLTIDDMRDPQLLTESRTALDELTQLLELPSVYCFQK